MKITIDRSTLTILVAALVAAYIPAILDAWDRMDDRPVYEKIGEHVTPASMPMSTMQLETRGGTLVGANPVAYREEDGRRICPIGSFRLNPVCPSCLSTDYYFVIAWESGDHGAVTYRCSTCLHLFTVEK